MQTEEELLDYFEMAMCACEGHKHEQELMDLLVSQMSDLTSTRTIANTSGDSASN
nr:hypothetical protein 4 [bacterium]